MSSEKIIGWVHRPPPPWKFRASDIVEEQAKTPLQWNPLEPEKWLKGASQISTEQASEEQAKRNIFWDPGWVKTGSAISTEQASGEEAYKSSGNIIFWPHQDAEWIKRASEISTEQAPGTEPHHTIAWRPPFFWKERATDIISGQASEAAQTYK